MRTFGIYTVYYKQCFKDPGSYITQLLLRWEEDNKTGRCLSSDGPERSSLQNPEFAFHEPCGLPAVASLHSYLSLGQGDATSHQHTSLIHTAQLLQVSDPCSHLLSPHNWMLSAPMQKSAGHSWTQAQGLLAVPYWGPSNKVTPSCERQTVYRMLSLYLRKLHIL